MEVKTYRAATMHDALALVRCDLGPDAAVLHTREVPVGRLWGWLFGLRQIEVTASADVNVPSRFANYGRGPHPHARETSARVTPAPLRPLNSSAPTRESAAAGEAFQGQLTDLQAMVKELCRRSNSNARSDLPDALFRLFTDLIDAELNEDLARELVEQVRDDASDSEMADLLLMKARIARRLETEINTGGPIAIRPGTRRIVALVGPTGVGKTTTIAKLAAHYRLKEKRKVGLITVDTYRIAAVEQLRTYADIIDLPMQVVSTPRDMREAVRSMDGLELILMDTAGRSPKDEVKIRELGAFLTEAAVDEVHLVLSAVGNPRTLVQTAEHFASVGTNSLILTKLDEATGLGNLLPLLRSCRLSLRYMTNGQNVPDDIETADRRRLSALMLGMESPAQPRCV
jgi:flagellar biosynthesis protein FlhF